MSYDYGAHNAHDTAAIALCKQEGWTDRKLLRAGTKNGYVYVFDNSEQIEIN